MPSQLMASCNGSHRAADGSPPPILMLSDSSAWACLQHTRALAADCQRLATEIEDMRCMRKRACQESLRTRVQLAVSDVNGASRAFQLTQMSCTSPTGISSSEQQASLQLADRALRLAVLAGGFDVVSSKLS